MSLEKPLDRIFIKKIALEAIIGVYDHERVAKQPLMIDLELFTDIKLPAKTGLISDTVDYDLVVDRVAALVQKSHYKLLESLIEAIADVILQEFKVQKVQCTVYKPQAIDQAETVGITIMREQSD